MSGDQKMVMDKKQLEEIYTRIRTNKDSPLNALKGMKTQVNQLLETYPPLQTVYDLIEKAEKNQATPIKECFEACQKVYGEYIEQAEATLKGKLVK